jgi:hypothetical protein
MTTSWLQVGPNAGLVTPGGSISISLSCVVGSLAASPAVFSHACHGDAPVADHVIVQESLRSAYDLRQLPPATFLSPPDASTEPPHRLQLNTIHKLSLSPRAFPSF